MLRVGGVQDFLMASHFHGIDLSLSLSLSLSLVFNVSPHFSDTYRISLLSDMTCKHISLILDPSLWRPQTEHCNDLHRLQAGEPSTCFLWGNLPRCGSQSVLPCPRSPPFYRAEPYQWLKNWLSSGQARRLAIREQRWDWLSRCQYTVTGWDRKFDLQLLSQCGSTYNCLSIPIPEIH